MRKSRKKKANKTLITAVIGVLIGAIIIVSGIVLLTGKHRKPTEISEAPRSITITKPRIVREDLLIRGCLFDLGIPRDQVRIMGRNVEVTFSKAPDASRIERVFSSLGDAPGVEVNMKEPARVALIINEKEWNIFFHIRKAAGKKLAQIAIIIDDMGQDMESALKLCSIDADITFSVMPNERATKEVADYLHRHGKEVMLHLPMEGNSGKNPGPDAIFHDTTPVHARKILLDALEKVPMAVGVNNHMGSVVTQDEVLMKEVLSTLKDRDIFFIDSVTTGNTVCRAVAADVELPFQARDVFLDNDQNYQYISGQLDELVAVAKLRGEAVGICHPHPATINALAREVPRLKEKGVEVVRASRIVNGR
jgi:polysaccharide deacetylase 2 family uncharacterized protein YibQ